LTVFIIFKIYNIYLTLSNIIFEGGRNKEADLRKYPAQVPGNPGIKELPAVVFTKADGPPGVG